MSTLSKQIETNNKNSILKCIEREGEISRASVAKQLNLSRTTVSTAVLQLIETELVREILPPVEIAQNRGRPGIPLALTSDVWYAAGTAFIDNELLFVLTNLAGEVVEQLSVPVPDSSSEVFLKGLVDGFSQILSRCPGRILPLLGVGAPGKINHGRILHASDMGWTNISVSSYLQEKLGFPSVIVNRHWASCFGEYRFGAGRDVQNLIYVGVSTGIAASIILDGQLITGAQHSAGEIGHTIVDLNGPICSCGRCGCLHTVASENALLTYIAQYYQGHPGPACPSDSLWELFQSKKSPNIECVCHAAKTGHPVALHRMEVAALYLGVSITNLIAMFNPQRVVLGGSFIEHGGTQFVDLITNSIHEHTCQDPAIDIRTWELGRYSGALGAALLVLEEKLNLTDNHVFSSAKSQ